MQEAQGSGQGSSAHRWSHVQSSAGEDELLARRQDRFLVVTSAPPRRPAAVRLALLEASAGGKLVCQLLTG